MNSRLCRNDRTARNAPYKPIESSYARIGMCIPDRLHKAHTGHFWVYQGIPDSYKPYRTEPPKMHICPNFDFKAHFPRFDMGIVLDTKNDIESRKMPIECKIELYTRYHSGMPCYFVPCYSAQIPEYCAGYARFLSIGIRWTSTEPHGFFLWKGSSPVQSSPCQPAPVSSPLSDLDLFGQKRTGAALRAPV